MHRIITLCVFILLISCNQQLEELNLELPSCIEQIVLDTNAISPVLTVQTQWLENEQAYWLNTDKRHSDGREYILNFNCDTICYFCGECVEPSCISKLDNDEWEIIWEN